MQRVDSLSLRLEDVVRYAPDIIALREHQHATMRIMMTIKRMHATPIPTPMPIRRAVFEVSADSFVVAGEDNVIGVPVKVDGDDDDDDDVGWNFEVEVLGII